MSAGGDGRAPGTRRAFRLPGTGAQLGRQVDDELRFHLEERIEELMAQGRTREEAEREAHRRFGDVDAYRRQATSIDEDHMRDRDRLDLLDAVARETRHAARTLRRAPAFSLVALVTLALGIGATTAIYSVLEAVVLRPLPYAAPERLVAVLHPTTVPGTGPSTWGLSSAGYFHFKGENRTLDALAAYFADHTAIVADGEEAERVRTAGVTHDLFDVLGGRAAVGRVFTAGEDVPNGPAVAMLGYDFWQRRYGGDPDVVGRTIETSGGPVEVVGVTARGFNLPKPGPFESGAELAGARVDLWVPLQLDPAATPQNSHAYFGVGRLRPGVTAEAAQRDLQALAEQFTELFPTAYSQDFVNEYDFRTGVQPLRDAVLGERTGRTLWVLFGAVGLVLLIACANVANLFLVRTEARRRETTLRHALGAGWRHLAVHHVAESLLLTLLAGALGLLLAVALVQVMLAVAPGDLPRLEEVGLRWTTVAFAAALSVLTGVVFGLFPLLRRRAVDTAVLREGARGLTPSPGQQVVRSGLVIAQVALALVLLASAGLMIRSAAHLRDVDPGLDAAGVLAFSVALPGAYGTPEQAAAFHRDLQQRLRGVPGVTHVGATTALPLRDYAGCSVVYREGRPFAPGQEPPCVATPAVTPGFFEALAITVEGRVPDWRDVDANTGAVVVTRALADRLWPGESAIGRGINRNGGDRSGYYRIVGVVPEVRLAGLDAPPTEAVFFPSVPVPRSWIGGPLRGATYVVRTSLADPTATITAVRQAVADLDARVPVANVTTMEQVVERSMARVSFIMLLLGVAATVALVLSAVGIYGVISYVVAQRRGEIGVRIALGAHASQVAGRIVRQSVTLALVGVAIGLAAAVATTRVLGALLYDVSPTDPRTLAGVALLLVLLAALAAWVPARRAARVDPTEALRA